MLSELGPVSVSWLSSFLNKNTKMLIVLYFQRTNEMCLHLFVCAFIYLLKGFYA